MAKLIYFSTNGKWMEFPLKECTTIGRHPKQDLQLLDRMISKEHAEIVLQNGHYVIRDTGSRNGTIVNDITIDKPTVLKDGDEIEIGNHILRFSDHDSLSLPQQTRPLSDKNTLGEFKTQSIRKRMSGRRFLPEAEIHSEAELREDYEKLRVAAELSAEAAATLNVDELLNIIANKAFSIFHADRVAILLSDDQGNMSVRIALDHKGRHIKNFKISETLLNEVILEKSAILSGDALQDSRFLSSNSLIVDNVRSTMCVPLLYQNEVLGVINLDTQMVTGAFVEKDLQILTGFARQAALSIQQSRIIEEMRRNDVIRENLRRIIPPHLIDEVMSGKIELQKSGRRTESTVLFADIRGFSRLTEQNEPEMIVNLLNDYFENMVTCIFKHEGALDKFVGDEVMALWGVNVKTDNHGLQAVKCALDMMKAVDKLNKQREAKGLPAIGIGIGIASGIMIAGYMGATQSMSYTVIGDTVNLASRLCSAARAGEILTDEETWKSLENHVNGQQLPPVMVKGKKDPVDVYRILRTGNEFK